MIKIDLVLISLSLLFVACSGQTKDKTGSDADSASLLYSKHCTSCHGSDGRKGMAGAKDLTASQLPEASVITIITNGSPTMGMPGFGKSLSEAEIKSLAQFVIKLRA
jgi:cytochrome c6